MHEPIKLVTFDTVNIHLIHKQLLALYHNVEDTHSLTHSLTKPCRNGPSALIV